MTFGLLSRHKVSLNLGLGARAWGHMSIQPAVPKDESYQKPAVIDCDRGVTFRVPTAQALGNPPQGDPPLDVRGFHEGILTYHTMTHRYKEENER